ncbi:AraC family transcriptional regulator [Halobacillus karajensis]|uniref:Right origin-binding protein n=1 Tax=Halobacillus karajensis TaxID=195088 RepID=A0A059NYU5_9BACI|nr:AraC family transcriptional regulator [Halobacillus karajensis]CDQ18497.1 Right origin-binding protein [Halobacillus karajensis]CDQ23431.1 Right origin-binding protein [Halobacillus karajensis]CDQ26913.1 Right origin-binding protein [Halobacillus karajensis]
MDMLKTMNEAMNYLEETLTETIDFKKVARVAHCSEYHFKRMFSFLAGITLSEYIRRRRLSLAAFELHHSKVKIIDVALKYGYHSPDSFTRAFQHLHGVTPSEARNSDQPLKAYPPMTFQLSIRGGNEMNYRIEQKEAFRLVGIMKRVPIVFEGENPEITKMWKSLTKGEMDRLKQLSNIEPRGMVQASTNFSEGRMEEKGELDQYIGVATTKEITEDFTVLEVPSLTWAKFESDGPFPSALQETWGRIYSEWFPSSNYQVAEGPEMLSIKSEDLSAPSVKSEIWIPVVKTS